MTEHEYKGDAIQQNLVCVRNLSVRKIDIGAEGAQYHRNESAFETVLLLTKGQIRGCDLSENVYTDFVAPHMIIMEKDKQYVIESKDEHVELFEIGALRHETGDIVNPDNLIRENYPFDVSRPYEDQINVN